MRFDSRLKGNLTEIIGVTLFEDAGYRVVPLGVEKVVREITTLNLKEYKELRLSKTLCSLPDFLITEADMTKAWMVEIKYRKNFKAFKTCGRLKDALGEQAEKWGDIYILLFVGEPADNLGFAGSHCGVIKILFHNGELHFQAKNSGKLVKWINLKWTDFARIQDIFSGIAKANHGTPVEKAVRITKALMGLDENQKT